MRCDIWKLFSSETDPTASTDVSNNGAPTHKDRAVQELKTSTDGRRSFRPRHAARDALLSVPVTTREYLHVTHRQQEVWNEIGFSPAQTTRLSYPQYRSKPQAGSSSQSHHLGQLELRNATSHTHKSLHPSKSMQHRSIDDHRSVMVSDTVVRNHEGKGKARAVNSHIFDQVRTSKRQDSAVAESSRRQMTEISHLSSVNEAMMGYAEMVLTADDYALWSCFNQEDQNHEVQTQYDHEVTVSSPAIESQSQPTMPHAHAGGDTSTHVRDCKPSGVSKADTEVPRLRPRRYFSHAEQKSYMSPHHDRTMSRTTDGSHRSSAVSQPTINHDAYDSSVNRSGTASTAPTIAESDGNAPCRSTKD